MRSACLALLLPLALGQSAGAQQEYRTLMVALAPQVAEDLATSYSTREEKVWCVTKWDTVSTLTPRRQRVTVYTVLEIERDDTGHRTDSHSELDPSRCRGADRLALPMIHSHPSGTCQASPGDNEAILQRMAPFDGILCGDRYAVWYFSARLVAELDQASRAAFGTP